MKSKLALWLLLAGFVGGPLSLPAQDGISAKKQEKILAKKAKEDKKAKVKKEKEDRKRHLSLQDKDTRKRIERNRRRAERGGMHRHRDGFFGRLFGR